MTTAMLATRARALTANRATGSCDDCTAKDELDTNVGKAMVNIIQKARVCARCCSQAPRLMKKAGMVHDTSRAAPA